MKKNIRKLYNRISEGEYTIGCAVRANETDTLMNSEKRKYNCIPLNGKEWYADPILYEYNEETYVFMEFFEDRTGRGGVGYSQILDNGKLTKPKLIIEEPWHLSFPYIFNINGCIYMMPESSEISAITIYRCVSFPDKWELVKKYENHPNLVDSIIAEYDGEYYFLSSHENTDNKLETQLVIAPVEIMDPDFEITFSRMFVAKSKETFSQDARMAGRIIDYCGKKYRVSQVNENGQYGISMNLCEIQKLSCSSYREEVVWHKDITNIETDLSILYSNVGIHTYGLTNKYEIVDIYLKHIRVKKMIVRIVKKLGRTVRKII